MGALLIPPHAHRDASELMHAADQAMYRAKQTGKNAIEIGRAGEPETAGIVRPAMQHRDGIA